MITQFIHQTMVTKNIPSVESFHIPTIHFLHQVNLADPLPECGKKCVFQLHPHLMTLRHCIEDTTTHVKECGEEEDHNSRCGRPCNNKDYHKAATFRDSHPSHIWNKGPVRLELFPFLSGIHLYHHYHQYNHPNHTHSCTLLTLPGVCLHGYEWWGLRGNPPDRRTFDTWDIDSPPLAIPQCTPGTSYGHTPPGHQWCPIHLLSHDKWGMFHNDLTSLFYLRIISRHKKLTLQHPPSFA